MHHKVLKLFIYVLNSKLSRRVLQTSLRQNNLSMQLSVLVFSSGTRNCSVTSYWKIDGKDIQFKVEILCYYFIISLNLISLPSIFQQPVTEQFLTPEPKTNSYRDKIFCRGEACRTHLITFELWAYKETHVLLVVPGVYSWPSFRIC